MSKPYSMDLRERVVAAVGGEGRWLNWPSVAFRSTKRSVWAFVHEEKLSYKKRRWSRPSANGPMSRVDAISG